VSQQNWSDAFVDVGTVSALPLPQPAREWAWGGSTGAGVRVAVVDSGVDAGHRRVGTVAGYVAFEVDPDAKDAVRLVEGPHEDLVGHGTACAAIIRSLAPDVSLHSVRVLGANARGNGARLLAGIRWAVEAGMDVVNLSLSSRSEAWLGPLREAADEASSRGCVLVCAANNVPGPTYPAEFASVISVAARPGGDPWEIAANPHPPVDFGARGVDVEVAWAAGGRIVATGNSFAAPHVAAMAALLRSRHPELGPEKVKAVLRATAVNAVPAEA
jgi:subtilisin family serine protease